MFKNPIHAIETPSLQHDPSEPVVRLVQKPGYTVPDELSIVSQVHLHSSTGKCLVIHEGSPGGGVFAGVN
ncbi:MAG: hypothetical protein WAM69_17200 [Candidatus Sulfotelmatobacter sp.]